MKLSSREQLLKEADEILRKLRKLNEAPTAAQKAAADYALNAPKNVISAANKRAAEKYAMNIAKTGGIPKIKEVDFGKDAKRFAKAYDGSDTRWKSKTMLSVKDAMDIMKQALPGGYNDFKAELIGKLPSDAKIQLGREGSVCLYVKTNTKPNKASLKADELMEVEPGLYRIWWD